MPTIKVSKTTTIGGLTISGAIEREVVTPVASRPPALAVAKVGALTTRTSDTVGTLTMAAGHGITTGAIIDIYWKVSATQATAGSRRGVTVGTVSVNSVPFSLGAGDNLPLDEEAITASRLTTLNVDVTGNEVIIAAASATRRCAISFQQNDGTIIKEIDLGLSGNDGEMWDWTNDGAVTNPFAGVAVGKICVSNGDSDNTNIVSVGFSLNNAA